MKSALSAARGRALNHAGLGLSNARPRKATQLRPSSRPVLAAGLPTFTSYTLMVSDPKPSEAGSPLSPSPLVGLVGSRFGHSRETRFRR
jgi:hypothetical protein